MYIIFSPFSNQEASASLCIINSFYPTPTYTAPAGQTNHAQPPVPVNALAAIEFVIGLWYTLYHTHKKVFRRISSL